MICLMAVCRRAGASGFVQDSQVLIRGDFLDCLGIAGDDHGGQLRVMASEFRNKLQAAAVGKVKVGHHQRKGAGLLNRLAGTLTVGARNDGIAPVTDQ